MKTPVCPFCGRRMRVDSFDTSEEPGDSRIRFYVVHECSKRGRGSEHIVEFVGPLRVSREKAIAAASSLLRRHVARCALSLSGGT